MSSKKDLVKMERVLKEGHGRWGVNCVASTKKYVITGGVDGRVVLWERGGAGKIVRTLDVYGDDLLLCLDTTPCEKYVVTGSWDATLVLWKLSNGNRERSFVGHTIAVYAVAVTPNGDGIVSGGFKIAILWNIHDSSRLLTFKGHKGPVYGVVVSSSGLHLYTCSADKTAIKWSMKTGERLDTFKGHEDRVRSCCLTSDDKYLITASNDKTAIVWNADDATRLRTLKGHFSSVISVCVSSCAPRIVATGSWDNTVILWDFQTATPVHDHGNKDAAVGGTTKRGNDAILKDRLHDARNKLVHAARSAENSMIEASAVFTRRVVDVVREKWIAHVNAEQVERTQNILKDSALYLTGSAARHEMSAHSDVEFVFACDDEGELCAREIDRFSAELIRIGISVDRINKPSMHKGTIARNEAELAANILPPALIEEVPATNAFEVASPIAFAAESTRSLRAEVLILMHKEPARSGGRAFRTKVFEKMLQWKLKRAGAIKNALNRAQGGTNPMLDAKRELYRPLQVSCFLSLFLGTALDDVDTISSNEVLDALSVRGAWSSAVLQSFLMRWRAALDTALRLRTIAHADAKCENDNVILDRDIDNGGGEKEGTTTPCKMLVCVDAACHIRGPLVTRTEDAMLVALILLGTFDAFANVFLAEIDKGSTESEWESRFVGMLKDEIDRYIGDGDTKRNTVVTEEDAKTEAGKPDITGAKGAEDETDA
eukprot:g909.t1